MTSRKFSELFENTHSYEEEGNDDIKKNKKECLFLLYYHFPMEDSSELFENTHSYEEEGNDDIKKN